MKNKYIKISFLLSVVLLVSCNDFLDVEPDRRTQLDSKEKISSFLVSAYPTASFASLTEYSSDNIDDLESGAWTNEENSMFYWEDVSETDSDTPESIWNSYYKAIAHSNNALEAIKKSDNPQELSAQKGEALITRAYAHFTLVNIFAKHYNSLSSDSDLGIVYTESPETILDPKYKRESVKTIYQKIERDLEEGLPLIDDEAYKQPKYHFNKAASYAFAARFYLYYEKWDLAEKYASLLLGNNPTPILKDWKQLNSGVYEQYNETPRQYASADRNANLLIIEPESIRSRRFYFSGSHQRFHHHNLCAETETIRVPSFFGNAGSNFYMGIYDFVHPYNTIGFYTMYEAFQITDPVAQIGNAHTLEVLFATDEALLVRAEARVMQKKYDLAIEDLKTWANNFCKTVTPFTEDSINQFFDAMEYSTNDVPTQKKVLNPNFVVEKGTQENLIHAVLQCRRILTLHEGLRWFDIKRYGIEISRRVLQNQGSTIKEHKDFLKKDDPRRAIQLPQSVIKAGLKANPR